MSKLNKEPIRGLDDEEIALLIDALTALRAERGKAGMWPVTGSGGEQASAIAEKVWR
ncbi:hypothetical protein UXN93_21015 [Enterobacter hormaechei]